MGSTDWGRNMASEPKPSKDGPQPDGSYIIDDTVSVPPSAAELAEILRKKREQPKPPPPKRKR
jgi:hypothetical protein